MVVVVVVVDDDDDDDDDDAFDDLDIYRIIAGCLDLNEHW